MRLIPKAKSIKIRIKSGGEEHSSLDSLKCCFSIKDIVPLLDGRLQRWLRQQKQDQLVDALEYNWYNRKLDFESPQGKFNLVHLFFEKEINNNGIKNFDGLAEYWMLQPLYKRNAYLNIDSVKNKDIVKSLYENRDKDIQVNWKDILVYLITNNEEDDPELYWLLGKRLYDGDGCTKNEKEGYRYIEKAAIIGYDDAKEFVSIEKENRRKKDTENSLKAEKLLLNKEKERFIKDCEYMIRTHDRYGLTWKECFTENLYQDSPLLAEKKLLGGWIKVESYDNYGYKLIKDAVGTKQKLMDLNNLVKGRSLKEKVRKLEELIKRDDYE